MTIWKRERTHFNYYITNERKQPHIYVEALGTPSASTEKILKDHGFKFDYNKCMYAAAQTNLKGLAKSPFFMSSFSWISCKKFFLFLLFEYKKGLLLVLYHK